MKISVQVQPRSKQQKIEKKDNGIWRVKLKSPPIDDIANKELIVLIAKECKVKKSQVTIKSVLSNLHKIVEIDC